ncbi:hypothetical protein OFO03_05035 [Campylobacter sp. JMF_02 ED1]|uniref:hypothetical protein n=1 Tax=unclassified Campylobacter TaxID=2593542 RepID=UPI0022E9D21B|nr:MULTISPECIES: hypothetical protein [unclassified Campylobacter]MDA3049320.1 hypothetical protein [Campylobacter sp. JMF_15 NE4]MDA3051255.1 hypothetical protein [Campylobacter sp. JMF_02 ED1]
MGYFIIAISLILFILICDILIFYYSDKKILQYLLIPIIMISYSICGIAIAEIITGFESFFEFENSMDYVYFIGISSFAIIQCLRFCIFKYFNKKLDFFVFALFHFIALFFIPILIYDFFFKPNRRRKRKSYKNENVLKSYFTTFDFF